MNQKKKNKSTTLIKDGHKIMVKDLFLNRMFLATTVSVDGKRAIPGTRRYEIERKSVSAKLDKLIDIAWQEHRDKMDRKPDEE